jgi:hypothetical protein
VAGVLALDGTLPALSAFAAPSTGLPTLKQFAALVGTSFRCQNGSRTVTLVLVKATALPADPLLSGSGYTLMFTGPPVSAWSGSMSTLSAPALKPVGLSVFPVNRPTAKRATYRVVVDQRKPVRRMPAPTRAGG